MKTALVTGAGGFTGKYVVDALVREGFRVVGVGLGPPATSDWRPCDFTDVSATSIIVRAIEPDVVFHLAALAFVGEAAEEDFYRVNVFGTLHLLEALAQCRKLPAKVLVASSANVYGNASSEPLSEDRCPAPVNHYACSKLAMEHMVRTWFDRLPILITRPFNYTGPGQDEKFVVPKIVGHYRCNQRSIKLGDISVERDFSDVQDVVEAYLRLMRSDARSEIVNICRGETISVAGIIAEMNALAGYTIQVEVQPELLRKADISRLVGDNTKLRRLTGFAPSTPIQATLKRMYTDVSQ